MKNFKIEWLKQPKINIIICLFLPIVLNLLLYIDLTFRFQDYLLLHQVEYNLTNWQLVFKEQSVFYIVEIVHILVAAIVYEIYIQEIKCNAWNLVASTQYVNKSVNIGKMKVALIDIFLFFVVHFIATLVVGKQIDVAENIEWNLFLKSFCIQFLTATMMVSFYIMIICIIKKIFVVIPLSICFFVLNITFYYVDDVKLLIHLPFTYGSYGFRASVSESIEICVICIVLTIIFYIIAQINLKRNHEIRL